MNYDINVIKRFIPTVYRKNASDIRVSKPVFKKSSKIRIRYTYFDEPKIEFIEDHEYLQMERFLKLKELGI
jgi:hypothetical protein